METAVPDALEGLEMSSANRRLPEELWAHVASYASRKVSRDAHSIIRAQLCNVGPQSHGALIG